MSTFTKYPIGQYLYCSCGSTIEFYEMGHGRTPYMINCEDCKVSLYDIAPSGIGWHLGHKEAIEIWKDYHSAIENLKERGHRNPSEKLIREYMYREAKGWGHNP